MAESDKPRQSDPYLTLTWRTRVRRLQAACRYLDMKFARVLGLTLPYLHGIQSGHIKRPTLYAISRIRLMERAFARQLQSEIKQGSGWGAREKVYERFGGHTAKSAKTRIRSIFRNSNTLPDSPEDIEALGGLEVFGADPAEGRNGQVGRKGRVCRAPGLVGRQKAFGGKTARALSSRAGCTGPGDTLADDGADES